MSLCDGLGFGVVGDGINQASEFGGFSIGIVGFVLALGNCFHYGGVHVERVVFACYFGRPFAVTDKELCEVVGGYGFAVSFGVYLGSAFDVAPFGFFL